MRPSRKCFEAALCLRAGLPDLEKHYDDQTLCELEREFPAGISLQELLVQAAHHAGRRKLALGGDLREVFEYAFPNAPSQTIFASFSTVSVTGILSNVANKFYREGFNAVEKEWEKICSIVPLSNFQPHSSYTLTGNQEFEKVGADGEIKHGTLSETSYQIQADTYAKMLSITRRDLVDDNLAAFSRIPLKLGRGAALKFNKIFWTAFLANSSFFTAPRNNFSDDAGTAFGTDSLIAADVMFKAQRDPDGDLLGSRARILLVPPALEIPAKRLMSSQKLLENSNGGDENPLAGMFRVVSSQYLADDTISGSSATAWYLLADPMDLPVIEVGFLNGKREPVIESAEANFSTLGIDFRGYFDFGISLQEYRGGVKFAGTAASTS